MTFVYLIAITVIVYSVTIALVVIGQEVSILLSIVLFLSLLYVAARITASRLTKL